MTKILTKLLICCLALSMTACTSASNDKDNGQTPVTTQQNITNNDPIDNIDSEQPPAAESTAFDLGSVPEYTDIPFVTVNNNMPFFTDEEIKKAKDSIENGTWYFDDDDEYYSDLDELGRCGVATALLSTKTMPADGEERGQIGMVKPAGWQTVKYPDVISDLYLYNRCHLIGWQLGNENANEKNLTTGTRYLNVEGMLPFENQTADYIHSTNNHVLYRITPVFVDDELVCRGILMEARSIEDDECVFNVYCYDVQPMICIDYLTGDSYQLDDKPIETSAKTKPPVEDNKPAEKYVLNTKSNKIHRPDCSALENMSDANRDEYSGDINDLIESGFTACKICNPT